MLTIPKTKVEARFYTFTGQYPPLYYVAGDKSQLTLASVNAGNSQSLEVGLGGVNKKFRADLEAAGQSQAASGKDDYQVRHNQLLTKAGAGGEAYETYQAIDPCTFSYVQANLVNKVSGWYEGACFVDVFSAKLCPDRNPLNAAMLYAAPPFGDNYASDADFLAAVSALAVNIIKTIAGYNARAKQQNVPPIQALRNTAYSTGYYNRTNKVDVDKIVRAIFAGFQSQLQVDNAGLVEIQFPVGTGSQDSLFSAVQNDLTQAPGGAGGVAVHAPGAGKPLVLPKRTRRILVNGKGGPVAPAGGGGDKKKVFIPDGVNDDGDWIELSEIENEQAAVADSSTWSTSSDQGQENVQTATNNEYGKVSEALQGGKDPDNYQSLPINAPIYEDPTSILDPDAPAKPPAPPPPPPPPPPGHQPPAAPPMKAQEEINLEAAESAEEDDDEDGGGSSRKYLYGLLAGLGIGAAISGALTWAFVFGGGRKGMPGGVARLDPKDVEWPPSGDAPPGDLDASVDVDILALNGNPVLIDKVEVDSSTATPTGSGSWTVNPANHAVFTPAVRTSPSAAVKYDLVAITYPAGVAKSDARTLTIHFSPTPAVDLTQTAKNRSDMAVFDVPSQYANFTGTIKLIDAANQEAQVDSITQSGVGIWSVVLADAGTLKKNQVTFTPDSSLAPNATVAPAPYVRLTAWTPAVATAPAKLSVTLPIAVVTPAKATSKFVANDTKTLGDWLPAYGEEGYIIAGDTGAKIPAYVTAVLPTLTPVTFSNVSLTDPHVLVSTSNPAKRVAAAWTDTSPLVIDLPFSDSMSHEVAIYCHDYDATAGAQQVAILDAATGAILDALQLTNFTNGAYAVWTITGPVKIRITNAVSGTRAVLSGMFFGGAATFAKFTKQDTKTEGNWKGVYGKDGFAIANDQTSNPKYCAPTFTPAPYVWAQSTTDVPALQKSANASDRVAAAWDGNFSASPAAPVVIDLPFTDEADHQVALYCLDYDKATRSQTVLVQDAAGTTLDTQTITSFANGVYLIWKIRGHVTIQVQNTGAADAVVSGVFFDAPTTAMGFASVKSAPKAYDFTVWRIEPTPANTAFGNNHVSLDYLSHCVAASTSIYPETTLLDGGPYTDVFADSGRWYWERGSASGFHIVFQPAYDLDFSKSYSMRYSVADYNGARTNTATMTVDYRGRSLLAPTVGNFLLPAKVKGSMQLACDVLSNCSAGLGFDKKSVKLSGLQNVLQGNPTTKCLIRKDGKSLIVPGEGIWMVDDNGLVAFQAESTLTHAPTAVRFRFSDLVGNASNEGVIVIDEALEVVGKVGPALSKTTDTDFWSHFRKHVIEAPLNAKPPVDLKPAQFVTIVQTLAVATRSLGPAGPIAVTPADFQTQYTKWGGGSWSDLVDICETLVSGAIGKSAPQFAARYWRLNMMVRMALMLMPAKS